MLTKSTTYKIGTEEPVRNVTITPLFLQNHQQPWQPNEIYELAEQQQPDPAEPHKAPEFSVLGKIIVDEQMDWHYEGDHGLSEEDIQQIAQYVLATEE